MISKNLLTQGVIVERRDAVMGYLKRHTHLKPFLIELIVQAKTQVLDPKEITVELYEEPEIRHRYLNVLVRQPTYGDLGGQLDRIWSEAFQRLRPDLTLGAVNLMTDFCHPGAT